MPSRVFTAGMFISVDPGFHQTPVNFGRVLKTYNQTQLPNAECPVVMVGSVAHLDCNKLSTLVLDTRQLDDSKWHKLFIRTDSFVANSEFAGCCCDRAVTGPMSSAEQQSKILQIMSDTGAVLLLCEFVS